MVRIEADQDVCQGYANCVVTSPDLFDLNQSGKVEVLVGTPHDDAAARRAVAACPVSALRLEDA